MIMTIEVLNPNGTLYATIGGEYPKKRDPLTRAYTFLFEAVCLFDLEMLSNERLAIVREYKNGEKLLEDPKHQREALSSFAKEYQRAQAELSTSYEELAFYSGFFEKYGKELGLTDEFRENGII